MGASVAMTVLHSTQIAVLDTPFVEHYWPAITKEMDKSPHLWEDWTKEALLLAVLEKKAQLWVAGSQDVIRLVFFSQVSEQPTGRVLEIGPMFGTGLREAIDVIDATMEKFARIQECERIVLVARPGMERFLHRFDMRKKAVVLSRPVKKQEVH